MNNEEISYIRCPTCNSYIPEDSKTCRICGEIINLSSDQTKKNPIDPNKIDHVVPDSGLQKIFESNKISELLKPTESPWSMGFIWSQATQQDVNGKNIGEYIIKDIIGRGGMGTVLFGMHPLIDKKVAIKILRPELSYDNNAMMRFIMEAKSVNAISHPNIIDIFSYGGFTDGTRYFVMEYLQGESLSSYLKNHKVFEYSQALHILKQILSAIKAAHKHNIIHRDLKPDNIFLVKVDDSKFPNIKILDFGIAKFSEESFSVSNTKTGIPIGTPTYMSPEQCAGLNINHQSDIYSLGIIMYEMFTGQIPFKSDSLFAILAAHISKPPIPPRNLVTIPKNLEEIILWCLAKEPELRPKNISQLEEALIPTLENIIQKEKENKPTPVTGRSFISIPLLKSEHKIPKSPYSHTFSRLNMSLIFLTILLTAIVVITFSFKTKKPKIALSDNKTKIAQTIHSITKSNTKQIVPKTININNNIKIKKKHSQNKIAIIKTKQQPKQKTKNVILHLQIEPPNAKYNIKINGRKKSKQYISIPWSKTKYIKVQVSAPGYDTWQNNVLPIFDQTIYVQLKKRKNKKNDNKPMNIDIPDIL